MTITAAHPKRDIPPDWPISGSSEYELLGLRRAERLRYSPNEFHLSSTSQPLRFTLGTYSGSERTDRPALFLSWSTTGSTPTLHSLGRLGHLVRSFRAGLLPQASNELWDLINRAAEPRTTEPETDDEIERWATSLVDQVVNADD